MNVFMVWKILADLAKACFTYPEDSSCHIARTQYMLLIVLEAYRSEALGPEQDMISLHDGLISMRINVYVSFSGDAY